MHKHTSLIVKVAVGIGTIATMAFAGVEPSPFSPIWRIIIIIIGG